MNTESKSFFSTYDGGNFCAEDSDKLIKWRQQEVKQLSELIYKDLIESKAHPFPYLRKHIKSNAGLRKMARNLAQFAFGIRFASRLITDGEVDPEEILNEVTFLNGKEVTSLFHVRPGYMHLGYVPENCPLDDLTGKIVVNLAYLWMLVRDGSVEEFAGSYGPGNHEDVAFYGAIEEFAHLVFDRDKGSKEQKFTHDFTIDGETYRFSRDEELDALVWKAIAESLFGTHYGFAQRLEEATDYQLEARSLEPEPFWDTGQSCLDFLGYDGHNLFPDEVMDAEDVRAIEGAIEIRIDDLDAHDYSYPHLLLIFGKNQLKGTSQWIIRHEEWVYCPRLGKVEARAYFKEHVSEVDTQIIIPILEGDGIPAFYYEQIVNYSEEYKNLD